MASYTPDQDDSHPPLHQIGTLLSSPPDYTTIATFPPGSFLENLAVRRDGTVLVSDMLSGSIWYIDPRKLGEPQETVELVHKFEQNGDAQPNQLKNDDEQEEGHGSYGSNPAAEAIVESPREIDVFYVTSGVHGKAGTWWIYEVDMRPFVPKIRPTATTEQERNPCLQAPTSTATSGRAKVTRLAAIPTATWLNGGTALSAVQNSLILMAESYQGRIYSYNTRTQKVDIWLDDPLLGKITTRPPWPGVNGLQVDYLNWWVYFTNSDRGILGRVRAQQRYKAHTSWEDADHQDEPVPGSVEVVATGCCGDDLCMDTHGNFYVAMNPMNTVLKFPRIAKPVDGELFHPVLPNYLERYGQTRRHDHRYPNGTFEIIQEPERQVILGLDHASGLGLPSFDPQTTGPTAVALSGDFNGDLYVTTNGGIINPLNGVVREAKLIRIDLTAWKQWKLDHYGRGAVEDSETDEEEEEEARREVEELIRRRKGDNK